MMAAQGRALGDYGAMLRRRKLLFVLGLIVGLLLGSVYLALAQRSYVATSKILVHRTATNPVAEGSRTTDTVNLDTEAQVVTSLPVAELAEGRLDTGLAPPALSRRVTVTVPPNTTVLEIAYEGPSAAQARDGSQAFASAYLQYRLDSARDANEAEASRVEAELSAASGDLRSVTAELANPLTTLLDRAALRAERSLVTTRIESLNTRLAALRSVLVRPGRIINPAELPSTPRTPNPTLVIPASLFVGLLLGLALAMWRDSRDPRVHSAAEVARLFGLAPLAELEITTRRVGKRRVRHLDVRALYHSVRAASAHGGDVVTVSSPGASGPGDAVASSLAETAARSGTRTLLAAADATEHPSGRRGRGQLTVASYEALDGQRDGALDAERFQDMIQGLRKSYDFTVLGPPTSDTVTDLPLVSRFADVVVLVVMLGTSTRPAVGEALQVLETTGEARTVLVTIRESHTRSRRLRRKGQPDVWSHDAGVDTPSEPGVTGGRPHQEAHADGSTESAVARP